MSPSSIPEDREQVIADLKAARDELVSRGRCKEDLVNQDGQVCLLGSVAMSMRGLAFTRDHTTAYPFLESNQRAAAVVSVLAEHIPPMPGKRSALCKVYRYNDSFASDADVLNLFDKALAELGGLA